MTTTTTALKQFDPENPQLFVRRTIGLGWDLNLGALAVRLGLIRPDDSLPDLDPYVPARVRRALALAPLVGAATTIVAAGVVGVRARKLPKGWNSAFRPRSFASPAAALAAPIALSVGAAGLAQLSGKDDPGANVAASALATGAQTMATGLVLAAARSAARPDKPSLTVLASILAYPVVGGGVTVGVVKAALSELDTQLRS
ncbi:hypothetical protein BSZ39_03485 [Bowdeniella nasicola]|uniref:DUF5808 domain-containing protein n=1 Tax=Bowdeniella nasicola TaxID=208480 RepID=A0A1Q5Q4F1_9ACTO|nr:hypothetical protein [Bowdeniella nasicola]OKL54530.1 hypothetical protein BSZ39_03485 [Bowdeniella nasicola]